MRPWVLVKSQESNLWPLALQSSALSTELVLLHAPSEVIRISESWISSFQVNTTSRQGIKQLEIFSASIFLLFSNGSSRGVYSWKPEEIPGPRTLMTTLFFPCGIRNPGLRNLAFSLKDLESRKRLESGIRSPEFKTVLDSLTLSDAAFEAHGIICLGKKNINKK